MSCTSCSTGGGTPKGCKSNGNCSTDSCNKLTIFDWLENMKSPNGQAKCNIVEVRFKNDRKHFFQNNKNLNLSIGSIIAVETQSGHDIGVVTLAGELVKVQMKKKRVKENTDQIKSIYRIATEKDIETWQSLREKERASMIAAREIASRLRLEMKISDIEYQGDGTKIIIYYTAESRIDFRLLIREYASKFNTRIEMKQIGYRQEASKVGGIGSCGRELCCSTWLTDFRSVSTSAARYQQLSINPQKLAGQCGKLKCCLNYELDTYLDALKDFPKIDSFFITEKGKAVCVKIDVFKQEMWFCYEKGGVTWYNFSVEQVREYIKINKEGKKVDDLEDLAKEGSSNKADFSDVIKENALNRFDRKNKNRRNRNKNRNQPKEKSAQRRNHPKTNKNRNSDQSSKKTLEESKQNQNNAKGKSPK